MLEASACGSVDFWKQSCICFSGSFQSVLLEDSQEGLETSAMSIPPFAWFAFTLSQLMNKSLIVLYFFADDVMQTTYCEVDLDKGRRDAFVYAIKNHYWYQMYIDDLPIWGE